MPPVEVPPLTVPLPPELAGGLAVDGTTIGDGVGRGAIGEGVGGGAIGDLVGELTGTLGDGPEPEPPLLLPPLLLPPPLPPLRSLG